MDAVKKVTELVSATVNTITKNHTPPYTLLCSGGVDSQAMLWSWFRAGSTFNVTTFRYVDSSGNSYNAHDISYIFNFAKKLGKTVDIIDINPFSFFENEYISSSIFFFILSFL